MIRRIKKITIVSFLILALLVGCVSSPSKSKQGLWFNSIEQAKAEAVNIKKDVLIIFTGSDWDEVSRLFLKNVVIPFSKDNADYVLVNIDITRGRAESSKNFEKSKYVLLSEYSVTEFPFLALQTFEGDVYALEKIPLNIDSESIFKEYLSRYAPARKNIIDKRKAIHESSGVEKAIAIDLFLHDLLNSDNHKYDVLRSAVPNLDPENKSGLKGRYLVITASIQAERFASKKEYSSAMEEFKKVLSSEFVSNEDKQFAWYSIAIYYALTEIPNGNKILEYLQKAIDAAPESEGAKQLRKIHAKKSADLREKK